SGYPVIGGLFGNAHIVYVALTHARVGNADKHRSGPHLLDVLTAGVSHRSSQTTCELVEYLDHAALVRHAPLDPFRNQFLELGSSILEITVRGAVALAHGAQGPHSAIGLVGRALIQLDLTGRFLGSGEEAADHDGVCPGNERFGDITREADTAV